MVRFYHASSVSAAMCSVASALCFHSLMFSLGLLLGRGLSSTDQGRHTKHRKGLPPSTYMPHCVEGGGLHSDKNTTDNFWRSWTTELSHVGIRQKNPQHETCSMKSCQKKKRRRTVSMSRSCQNIYRTAYTQPIGACKGPHSVRADAPWRNTEFQMDTYGIGRDHIWNIDETSVHMLPAGTAVWRKKGIFGQREVPPWTSGLALLVAICCVPAPLLSQIICAGKKHVSLSTCTLPSFTENHWTSQESLLKAVK